MKKTLKKLISTVLAVVLLLSAVPFTASAETSGTCGEDVNWTYDESTGELTIEGEGEMNDYKSYNRPWDPHEDNITTIIIHNGVTSIGDYAFYSCGNLTSVTIGNGVTTIGDNTFSCCDSLTNITVDADNQYYSSDSYGMLYNKDKTELIQYPIGVERTSFTIPDSVTTIGEDAFYWCDSLTNVTIPDSVTTIGDWAFRNCDNLTSVTIGNGVTTIGAAAFYYCSNLTSVTIGDSVTTIGEMAFDGCENLTDIDIPDSVIFIGNRAFQYCSALTSIIIPDSVTTIELSVFCWCDGLTSVLIGNGITTIEASAFYDCTSLTSVTIPASVTTIGHSAFMYCISLTDVYYNGTEEEWNAININEYNEPLFNATIHFLVEEECSHSYTHMIVPSTCKVQGMEYDLCTVCGETANSKTLPLADHSLVHYSNPSTCKVAGYEYDKCSACGDEFNYIELPLAEHSWSDWAVTREPTVEAEGEETRTCSVCDDVESRVIPKLEVIKDDETGVEIVYGNEYESGVEIKVTPVYDGASYQIIESNYGNVNSKIFDISTVKDGQKVQPNGKVKVRIPVPADFTSNNIFVCYVDSVNGTVENIPATIKNGYIEFEAEHFSYYAIMEKLGKVNSVDIADIEMNSKDSTTITPNISADEGVEYTVTYSSSDTDVAYVDENGNVTATGKGSAEITVTVTDEYGNVVTDTCDVEVKYTFGQWLIIILLFGWIWYI